MRLERNHQLGIDEAKQRVDRIRSGIEAQYGLSGEWNGDTLRFTGASVNGHIVVSEQRVLVEVRLGFAMMLLEGPIRSHISAALDEHLVQE
jgi:putative polyhydroxyalkanoate system protein